MADTMRLDNLLSKTVCTTRSEAKAMLRRGAVRDGLLRFSWPALNESSYDLKEMEK